MFFVLKFRVSCFFLLATFFLIFMLRLNFIVSFDACVLSFGFNFQHQCFVRDN